MGPNAMVFCKGRDISGSMGAIQYIDEYRRRISVEVEGEGVLE